MDESSSKAAPKGGGNKDGGGGGGTSLHPLNSGVFNTTNSSIFNSGIFNNASFGSFSNLQDLPFFESLASLGDMSSLGAAFHQSIPSIPEHLAAVAAAHAAATAAAGQQGSSTNLSHNNSLNLGRNDSFANLTQSSLHNLQLFLSEVEQGVIASGQVQPQQLQQSAHSPQSLPVQQQQQQQHPHQSQQAQPLPPAAAATYAPIKAAPPTPHHHHHTLQPLKAGPAPTPIALTPIYPSPAQFAAFAPSMHAFPHHLQQQQQQPQHSTQQWGPRPSFGGNAQSSPKMPLAPMMGQGGPPSLAPISGPPSMGVAVPQEFSSTLYSLASTLPPPMILSNDSVLGSVGGGLHFQRHCVRRRMPDELAQSPDPSMFLN